MEERYRPLHTVHDAMIKAVLATKEKGKLETATFKVHPQKKDLAEQICKTQGTTLSEFLRECVNGLVEDYIGPRAADKIEVEETTA